MSKKVYKHDYESNLRYLKGRISFIEEEFNRLVEELVQIVKDSGGVKNAHTGDILTKLDNLYSATLFYTRAISVMEGNLQ